MFEIKTGKPLFHPGSSLRSLIRDFELLLGPLPEPYRSAWNAPERQGVGSSVATGDSESGNEDTVPGSTDPTAWEPASLLKLKAEILAGSGGADVLEGKLLQERTVRRQTSPENPKMETTKYRFPRGEALLLANLLRGMLKYDPDERMTLEAICHHLWPDNRSSLQKVYERFKTGAMVVLERRLAPVFVLSLVVAFAILLDWTQSSQGGSGKEFCPQGISSTHILCMSLSCDACVCWLKEPPEDEIAGVTEQLVREEAVKFRRGITDIRLLMDGHSRTTAGYTADGGGDMVNDDCHMTVRMGNRT
ncbi:hypothetical protein DL766_010333 [Monosporascus sp. MC13-8B]|uniref:Protein kinase domain-containing protein n=1 Tax=Monosporascus cannonballus TaxID=155416 RepID=A0ABY0GTV3_9PEZI|nr:hypothetical protein DL762_009436 [Monosporascus cannonballus]RYO79080.1 hypothetical protein DL763_009421 [Monosporascus cannonballus]RYP02506.1 hypothetical protein DL766_010333 [Monosporascus sp. MC13-8B]